jgi:hypothetical protein
VAAGARSSTRQASAPPTDESASRIAKLEQQCTRLAHELSSVACDADRRDREHRVQIDALVRRLHECESELSEREGRLVAVTQAYEGLRSQVEQGGVPASAAAVVYRREVRRHAELADSLRTRFGERGHALELAREQIAVLHAERARLMDALEERGRQVAQLLAQLTRGEAREGFGMDFRSGLGQLIERDPVVATGEDASGSWTSSDINEHTIVLDPEPAPAPAPAAAAVNEAPCNRGRAIDRRQARARGPRLRRYLMPMEPETDSPFELTGPRSYVGRGVEADVCLGHPTISRLHGVLYCIGGSTIVEDARSSNGTFVNRERVQQATLKDGDIVSFGNVAFRFRVAISDG